MNLRRTGFCLTGLFRVVCLIGWVMPTIVVGVYSVSVDEFYGSSTRKLYQAELPPDLSFRKKGMVIYAFRLGLALTQFEA